MCAPDLPPWWAATTGQRPKIRPDAYGNFEIYDSRPGYPLFGRSAQINPRVFQFNGAVEQVADSIVQASNAYSRREWGGGQIEFVAGTRSPEQLVAADERARRQIKILDFLFFGLLALIFVLTAAAVAINVGQAPVPPFTTGVVF